MVNENLLIQRVGLNILILRKSLKMTQTEFAKRIGVSRSALSYYESGDRTMDVYTLYKICEEFNVSPNHLTGFSQQIQTDYVFDSILESLKECTDKFEDSVEKILKRKVE